MPPRDLCQGPGTRVGFAHDSQVGILKHECKCCLYHSAHQVQLEAALTNDLNWLLHQAASSFRLASLVTEVQLEIIAAKDQLHIRLDKSVI